MIRRILDLLIYVDPIWWSMNYAYDPKWDKELNLLLDSGDFYAIGEYRACIKKEQLWISNYPYASFTKIDSNFNVDGTLRLISGRPSRRTILKAKRKLDNDRKYYNLSNEEKLQKLRDEKLTQLGI
jgi:hypothetical protein